MVQGIIRAANWLYKGRRFVWLLRGMRWCGVLSVSILVARHAWTWADAVAIAFCLYGELRDWGSRKRGYAAGLQIPLLASLLGTTVLAVSLRGLIVRGWSHDVLSLGYGVSSLSYLDLWLRSEILFQRSLAKQARTAPSAVPPPRLAEYVLFLVLPRRQREPFVGDVNEDFATNVVPKFGPFLALGWYWIKTIQYVAMYTCENLADPLLTRVVEPLWRRVVLPLLKWIVAPALVVHKLGWADAMRAFADTMRAIIDRLR